MSDFLKYLLPNFYMRLTPLNTLPPRDEYLQKVCRVLIKSERTEKEILVATGLTKTQALCALEVLIKRNVVVKDVKNKRFKLVTSVDQITGEIVNAKI